MNDAFSINRLDACATDFEKQLNSLLAWEAVSDTKVNAAVSDILSAVKQYGDDALLQLTAKYDQLKLDDALQLEISQQSLHAALQRINPEQRVALESAAERIRIYHEYQKQDSWQYEEKDGTVLGQIVRPIERVGIYVPGGKAAYPSTVLMDAIPAKVADVDEIIMVSPASGGKMNDMVLAAAAIAGVDRVFSIGGAQAIAALSYGTSTVPKVDKIVGPGNIYVATAKRMVFGEVGLDMVAGPSEILVICDGKTDPEWIAMDLFSQAEHDEDAQSILISDNAEYLEQVVVAMEKLLPSMERKEIITASLARRGVLILASDQQQILAIVNRIAPEHLELSVENPQQWLPDIKNAGAIFMGRYTAEAVGDYCAGPNHTLPTSATARFSSPLGVYDFQKRTSLIHCSEQGASELGKVASVLARGESLTAHACSAEYRIKK